MSIGRRPPVASPVPFRGFGLGLGTALVPARRRRAEAAIHAWLQERFAARAAVLLSSGTAALTEALTLAIEATGRRRVALPAYGCFDLATACDGAGVEVVLYDLDPATLGPAWDSLARAVDQRTAAVVLVHLFGVPVDVARVQATAHPAGALVIEDAAQGIGGSIGGRPLGGHGDFSVLSFGRGKGLTAGGGGALLAHQPGLADRLAAARAPAGGRGLAGLAVSLAQWSLGRPGWYWLPSSLPFLGLGETPYHPPAPTMTLSAAGHGLLSSAITVEPQASEHRRAIAAELRASLAGCAEIMLPAVTAGGVAGYLRFPVLASPALSSRLRAGRVRDEGILPGYPQALCDLPGFRERQVSGFGDYAGARSLAAGLFTLPTHRWTRVGRVAVLVCRSR